MREVIKELDDLSGEIVADYNLYASQMVTDFFRPFFGDSMTVTMGKDKGKEITIEKVVEEASKDINFVDLFFSSMANSSDLYLQLFDNAVKNANDKARHKTISDSKEITRLRLYAEEHGINDYEWMFEKDSDGNKTGMYVGKYNIGEFRKAKERYVKSLDTRYGEHPVGMQARLKRKAFSNWLKANADPDDTNYPAPIEKWEN